MALLPVTLEVLGLTLRNLEGTGCGSRRILSLGYPDILASKEAIREFFGDSVAAKLEYRADSASILRWHNASHLTDRIPDAPSLFRALGYELEVIDLVAARGGEIIQDLNDPIPENLKMRYAVLLDAGTVEHCFNIGQAARNVAEMIAEGGAILHGNPLNMFNHGFYNLNPTWYHDFYETNGFVVEYLSVVQDAARNPRPVEVPAFQRFSGVPENCTLLVVARRAQIQPIRWPVQRKYRDNPGLRG